VNPLWRGLLDVAAIEPVSFSVSKIAGEGVTLSNANSLINSSLGKISRSPPLAPSQKREIVHQGLGQNPHFAKIGDGGRTMALGQPFAIRSENRRQMRELRHGQPQAS